MQLAPHGLVVGLGRRVRGVLVDTEGDRVGDQLVALGLAGPGRRGR
jgi:hypothetical protein